MEETSVWEAAFFRSGQEKSRPYQRRLGAGASYSDE